MGAASDMPQMKVDGVFGNAKQLRYQNDGVFQVKNTAATQAGNDLLILIVGRNRFIRQDLIPNLHNLFFDDLPGVFRKRLGKEIDVLGGVVFLNERKQRNVHIKIDANKTDDPVVFPVYRYGGGTDRLAVFVLGHIYSILFLNYGLKGIV